VCHALSLAEGGIVFVAELGILFSYIGSIVLAGVGIKEG